MVIVARAMQSVLFHNPHATFSSHRIFGKKVGRLSLHRPDIICRSFTADDDTVPRRGIGIEITSHEKKRSCLTVDEGATHLEKKEEENIPFQGEGFRRLHLVIGGLMALVKFISRGNPQFPFKTHPRTMKAFVMELLINAFATYAEGIFFVWWSAFGGGGLSLRFLELLFVVSSFTACLSGFLLFSLAVFTSLLAG